MTAAGPIDLELTSDVTPHVKAVLELDAGATATADQFLFDHPEQADAYRQFLLVHDLAAFTPPHGIVALMAGRPVGMVTGLMFKEFMNRWMTATMTLDRSGFLAGDVALAARFRGMARVNPSLREGDFYLDRIAVVDGMRGSGVAFRLFEALRTRARDLGGTRLVADVSVTNEAANRFFARQGMREYSRGRAHDQVSGRSIEHVHLAAPIAPG